MIPALNKSKLTITHGFIIFTAILVSFLASKTTFGLQMIALIVVLYIMGDFLAKKFGYLASQKKAMDIFFLTAVIFLVVFSTGALYSPLYFLIYFLLFGVSLLFEPTTGIILSIIGAIFLLMTPGKEVLYEFLQLASLFLIAPLSTIFGSQYKKLLQDEQMLNVLAQKGKSAEMDSLKKEQNVKSWAEGDFRNRLAGIWNDLDSLVQTASTGKPYDNLYQKLKSEIVDLLKSTQNMQKKVEE